MPSAPVYTGLEIDMLRFLFTHLILGVFVAWHAHGQQLLTPEGDGYETSLSEEIRVNVTFDDECREKNADVLDSTVVIAEEVTSLANPRRMMENIHAKKLVIDNREPYRDYKVMLLYLKENFVVAEKYLSAYNSPSEINFDLDCANLKTAVWDARRERAAKRSAKKKDQPKSNQKPAAAAH